MMESRAAVFREVGAPVSIERITLDPPGPTGVLVRIAAVGLCRTDYHVMRGERRVAMRPMVLGHEAAGVVEQIGEAVGGIKPGDHVVLTFVPACGNCHWCRQGLHHLCAEGPRITQGPQLDGTYRRRDRDGHAVGAFCMIGGNHAFVCIVVTALTPDTLTEIKIPPLELFVTQKAIMGAVYGFASPRLQIPELLGLYRKGAIKLRELITRTYRLDQIDQGYADLDAGKNLRGVVVFDG